MATPKVQERERIGTDGGTVNGMADRPFNGAATVALPPLPRRAGARQSGLVGRAQSPDPLRPGLSLRPGLRIRRRLHDGSGLRRGWS